MTHRSPAKNVTKRGRSPAQPLTRRQGEVVGLLALGLSDMDIADALGLSRERVARHLEHVTQNLGVSSRAQVATWAVEHDLAAGQDRLLTLLERLLEIEGANLDDALNQAAQVTVEAFGTDKVDIFIFSGSSNSLIARGASQTPLGVKQRAIGMDVQPLANGGRAVDVFRTGECYVTGHADQDPRELIGVTDGLGVRSEMIVPLVVGGERRGVLAAQAEASGRFSERDLRFLQAVSRWIGGVVHRVELMERSAAAAREQGRRAAADELVMVVAHDLRNHLTPLRGRADLLRRQSALAQDARSLDNVEALQNSLARLEAMIADLLDVARLEHGLFALVQRRTDLVALVHETSARFDSEQKPLLVQSPEQLIAHADPDRVRQALENLVANALKHAPEGTPVQIHVSANDSAAQPVVRIGIADQGAGLAADVVNRLFERFASGGRSPGLGLGLYLAHRIAVAHGGSIEVDSTIGRGSTFTLVLPLALSSIANVQGAQSPQIEAR